MSDINYHKYKNDFALLLDWMAKEVESGYLSDMRLHPAESQSKRFKESLVRFHNTYPDALRITRIDPKGKVIQNEFDLI